MEIALFVLSQAIDNKKDFIIRAINDDSSI
jgi:hypothetical protein